MLLSELLCYYHFLLKKNTPARSWKARPPHMDPEQKLQTEAVALRTSAATAAEQPKFLLQPYLPLWRCSLLNLLRFDNSGKFQLSCAQPLNLNGGCRWSEWREATAERRVTDCAQLCRQAPPQRRCALSANKHTPRSGLRLQSCTAGGSCAKNYCAKEIKAICNTAKVHQQMLPTAGENDRWCHRRKNI